MTDDELMAATYASTLVDAYLAKAAEDGVDPVHVMEAKKYVWAAAHAAFLKGLEIGQMGDP